MFCDLRAMERVAFQHNSALRTRIISVCADFLKWVQETRYFDDNGQPLVASDYRINEAMKYADKIFAPALTNIILEELKLKILIQNIPDRIANSTVIYLEKNTTPTRIEEGHSLSSGMSHYNKDVDITVFDNFTRPLDLEKSTFVEVPDNYIIVLFNFITLFLGDEVFPRLKPLTAEEHAASILHECGHILYVVEHISDIYHRVDIAGNSIRYINEDADVKTVTDVTERVEKEIKKDGDKITNNYFEIAMQGMKKTKEESSKFIQIIIPFGACVVYLFYKLRFLSMILRMYMSGRFGFINSSSHKSSDTVVTESNAGYEERLADEFVSRHGLSAELASALKKMEDSESSVIALRESIQNLRVMSSIFYSFDIFCKMFGMLSYVNDGTYDPMFLRLEHLLNNSLVVFKDVHLDDKLKNYYIKQTQLLLETLKSYKSTSRYKFDQIFWGTIMRILSRGSIVDGFSTAGLSQDYDILQRLTGGLIKNKLYYHAARLKSI